MLVLLCVISVPQILWILKTLCWSRGCKEGWGTHSLVWERCNSFDPMPGKDEYQNGFLICPYHAPAWGKELASTVESLLIAGKTKEHPLTTAGPVRFPSQDFGIRHKLSYWAVGAVPSLETQKSRQAFGWGLNILGFCVLKCKQRTCL